MLGVMLPCGAQYSCFPENGEGRKYVAAHAHGGIYLTAAEPILVEFGEATPWA